MRPSDPAPPNATVLAATLAATFALALAAGVGAASPLRAEPLFTGVFSRGTDAYQLWALPDWQAFRAKWHQAAAQGLHLVAVRTYVASVSASPHGIGALTGRGRELSTRRFYAGAWRQGGGVPEELLDDLDAPSFEARNRDLAAHGLLLVDVDTYLDAPLQRKFMGAWRAGKGRQELAMDLDGPALASRDETLATRGLRPVRIRAWRDHGRLHFLALWCEGTGDHHLLTGLDGPGLARTQTELAARGLHLVDVDAYDDDRGRRRYAGIWRAGVPPSSLWTGDWESFTARWHELAGRGERLTALAVAPGPCPDACANRVVANRSYDYGIRATSTHCQGRPGTCGTPGPEAMVVYHWPVTTDGAERYARLSALTVTGAPFTLPFTDPAVQRRAVWLYGPGNWHHAADFSREDELTFAARAAAPGKVIFIGWDPWSGNTVIVSHDADGAPDGWRTIYMHLRDGARHDCTAAWSETMAHPPGGDHEMAAYRAHLLATGCTEDPAHRHLDPLHWGTEAETIDRRLLGKHVAAGQFLAWAGDTGPGGKRGTDRSSNTHLHVFFARRDPTDENWYFIDPYGIYGPPACYPAQLTGHVAGACVRYPVAWAGGHPHFP